MDGVAPKTRHSLLTLYPLAQAAASEAAAAVGKDVSCRKGCAACCRQLVAVSTVEAVAIADLVAAMPAERQAVVRGRFADTLAKLEDAGLLDRDARKGARSLSAPLQLPADQAIRALARAYFGLRLDCPFLEDELCSIHADRPVTCREYQVTSPAENCSRVYEAEVDGATPDVRAGNALMHAANAVAGLPSMMLPLILSLEWAERLGPEIRRERDGGELVRAFEAGLQEQRDSLSGEERPPDARPGLATADIELGIGGRRLSVQVTVSTGPTTARAVLPVGRALADIATQIAVEDAAKAGTPVSCRAGCGACCRHLVPLSEPEAFEVAALVRSLPEPRRSAVLARFAEARRWAEDAGLWDGLFDAREMSEEQLVAQKRAYFAMQSPCPFLEDESCSIYDDRPLTCREYMVNSDPAFCADPHRGRVAVVSLPVISPFRSFAIAAHERGDSDRVGWVPLVAALEWAEGRPEPSPTRPGPDWLRAVFSEMTGAAPPPGGPE